MLCEVCNVGSDVVLWDVKCVVSGVMYRVC